MKRENLDPKLKKELVAKLKALNSEVEDKTKEDLERKRATRYHKVKFFERRKLDRKLETSRKRLAKAANEAEAAEVRKEVTTPNPTLRGCNLTL